MDFYVLLISMWSSTHVLAISYSQSCQHISIFCLKAFKAFKAGKGRGEINILGSLQPVGK